MKTIQILGTGCPKCKRLTEAVQEAVNALGVSCEVEKVTDLQEILAFGVMMTPALVVDGEVKAVGKVPTTEEIRALIA